MNAAYRMFLLECAAGDWFARLGRREQQAYLKAHPKSRYAVSAPAARRAAPARPATRPRTPSADDAPPRAASSGSFRARGISLAKNSVDALRNWNDMFRRAPSDYHHAVTEGTGLTPTSEIRSAGNGRVMVTTHGHDGSGNKIMEARRLFQRDHNGHLNVTHDYMELHGSHQGHGIAKHFLRNSMREYRRMGVHAVSTHANVDVGGYAWAKYGFLPEDPDAWEGLQRDLTKRFAKIRDQVPAATRKHVDRLLRHPDRKSLWQLADLQEPVTAVRHDDTRSSQRRETLPLGKHLLLGSSWYGHLPMKDPDAMRRFKTYVK